MSNDRRVLREVGLADLCVEAGGSLRSRASLPFPEPPLLVVDLTAGPADPAGVDFARLRQAVGELPCVTVGVGAPPEPLAYLSGCFDLVVETRAELEPVVRTVARSPLASLALVQQLRLSRRLGIHEGLVSESALYGMLQGGPEFAAWLETRERKPESGPVSERPVVVEREGPLLRLTLNRPERRNAFDATMRDGLVEALELVIADPSITAVRLQGAGDAFCSGGDLDEFGRAPDPATAHAVRSTRNAARTLAHCAGRVEAVVHGAAIGAGVELAALCHRVTARPDSFFLLPEVGMGLIPGSGGTVSLPRRIGSQRTAWMALSGQRIDAETALEWGLIDEIDAEGGYHGERRMI